MIKPLKRKLMLHYASKKELYCSWGRNIYRYDSEKEKASLISQLPTSKKGIHRFLSNLKNNRFGFLQNDYGPSQVFRFPDQRTAAIYDSLYYQTTKKTFEEKQLKSFFPPLNHSGCTKDYTIYWGEYQNSRPYSPRIVSFDIYKNEFSSYTKFPKGAIKHIHSITYDKWRNWFWICTGDNNKESGIYYTRDYFKTLECIGSGDQGWRAVSLVVQKDRLVWGSDLGADVKDKKQKNYLYEYIFEKKQRSIIQELDNPVYYSYVSPGGKIFFGTTYEPGAVISNKKSASILFSSNGKSWEEICSFPYKDNKRPFGTKYGTVFFPKGSLRDESLYFSLLNVEKYDGYLMKIKL